MRAFLLFLFLLCPWPARAQTFVGQYSACLRWDASPTEDVIGYEVYRSTISGQDYAPVGQTSALHYEDAAIGLGTTYYYVVTAIDQAGAESVPSNEAIAIVPGRRHSSRTRRGCATPD